MGTITTHLLGAVDFTDDAKYHVMREGDGGWDPQYVEDDVPLRTTDGAVLAYSRISHTIRTMAILCLGSDYAAAKTNADAIDLTLIAARNSRISGTPVVYSIQETSEGSPDNWKILGGIFKRTNMHLAFGRVDGLLTIHLSKV